MIWADISIKLEAAARPVKSGDRVKLVVGPDEIEGRVFFSHIDVLIPGESASGQLAVKDSVHNLPTGDFTVRTPFSAYNIGSGKILCVHGTAFENSGLGEKQQVKVRKIEDRLLTNPFQPVLWSLISKELFFFNPEEGEAIRRYLEEAGIIVAIAEDLYFHRDAVTAAEKMLREYLERNGSITSGEARDLLGSSRKFVIPLLEYFDAQGVTVRQGNERVLA